MVFALYGLKEEEVKEAATVEGRGVYRGITFGITLRSMMRTPDNHRIDLICTTLLLCNGIYAQNLVMDPSFEIQNCCPVEWGPSDCATFWTTNMNSWDYFHSCNQTVVSVPDNFAGHQPAATGEGYAGFAAWGPSSVNAPPYFPIEIVGGILAEPLTIGTTYHVSFRVSLASAYLQCCYGDSLGLLFVSTNYGNVGYPQTGRPPVVQGYAHVYGGYAITDSVNWTTIQGSFTADSAYTHFLIGRFFTGDPEAAGNCWCNFGNKHAYYYLDDVCVSVQENVCYQHVGVASWNLSNPSISWSHVPDGILVSGGIEMGAFSAALFDSIGRCVLSQKSSDGDLLLRTNSLTEGAYILHIHSGRTAPFATKVFVPSLE